MVFVSRVEGRIMAVSVIQTDECNEWLDSDNPEINLFMLGLISSDLQMLKSDLSMIRVIEDLLEVLLSKNIVALDDFPEAVQFKLAARRKYRINVAIGCDSGGLIKL